MASAFHIPPPWIEWTPAGLPLGDALVDHGWSGVPEYVVAAGDSGPIVRHVMNGGLLGASYPVRWQDAGEFDDVDVLAEVNGESSAAHPTIGPCLRSQLTINQSGYFAYLAGSAFTLCWQGGGISNVRTVLASTPMTYSSADRRFIRIRAVGSTISAKTWLSNTPEPGGWQLEAEDATYASGLVGISGQGRSSNARAFHSLRVEALAT